MTEGIDFGKIPGVSKPSLLKPGAEKIANLFGFSHKFEKTAETKNWTGEGNPEHEPFFEFEYRCSLYKGDQYVGNCDGSCNSWEKKYRYRKAEIVCPKCGKKTIIKGKKEYGGGWVCFAKKGGCGAKFADNDPEIVNQPVGDIKNFDTAEQVNTIQKMAQKRAYVGAVIIACNLSEYFTQDVEDMDRNLFQADEPIPAPEPEAIEGDFTPVVDKPFDPDEFLRTFEPPANIPYIPPAKANEEIDSNGEVYKDISVENLRFRLNALIKYLIRKDLPKEKIQEARYKLGIISSVLGDRKAKLNINPIE